MTTDRELADAYGLIVDLKARIDALEKRSCQWTEDDDGVWDTECGNAFVFTDGGPSDNNLLFCPYCGAALRGGSPYTTAVEGGGLYTTGRRERQP